MATVINTEIFSKLGDQLQQLRLLFYLTISMRGQRATGKIQRNDYHHGSCGPFLKRKTMSVFLIFMHGTRLNVKNRCSPKGGMHDREWSFYHIIIIDSPQLTWRCCHYDK